MTREYLDIVTALRCDNPACVCHKNGSNRYTLHCPAHSDKSPSLSLTVAENGKILLKDFGNCEQSAVIGKLRDMGLWHGDNASAPHPAFASGLTLQQYADAKKLPVEFLHSIRVSEQKRHGTPVLRVSYLDENGGEIAVRYRLALQGGSRFIWRKGDKPALYGLWRLIAIRRAGWVILVEGESDCHTLWHYNLPALGVPGNQNWRSEWRKHLDALTVYVWQEPGAADFAKRIGRDAPALRLIPAPEGIKDPSAAHLQGIEIPAWLEALKANALSFADIVNDETQKRLAELEAQAARVLAHPDPLELVQDEIRKIGYGGDISPALVVYLAATSRVLEFRKGSMPAHTILLGGASAGKSHTINTVRQLFSADAFHTIDAGSPRALIYDQADLRHRVVVFAEADSIPNDEDNPAASAIRNLLAEGALHYSVVVRDEESGEFVTKEIDKPGPTVLLTTATRRLGEQLMTRLFTLEISDDADKVRAALKTQARIELEGAHEPDAALIAFQAYLQVRAPFRVYVPFADALADEIGKSITASRILRDYARLLSLIKAIAVIRHRKRETDATGRIVAQIEDYATTRELVNQMYVDSASGAGARVRQVVATVAELRAQDKDKFVDVSRIAKELGVSNPSASRYIKSALRAGWLVNHEQRKGFPFQLDLGDSMPGADGLPEAAVLQAGVSVFQVFQTAPKNLKQSESPILSGDSGGCFSVSAKTGESSQIVSRPPPPNAPTNRPTREQREAWLEHARKWLEFNRNHAEFEARMAVYEQKLGRHYELVEQEEQRMSISPVFQ